nr:LysR family transcriptional regulator [Sinorhizobium meliloti]
MLEERSVARCAERLFVSPSAVSHALAKLRQMFSDPLFVRTGGGMLPTARAQSLERSLSLLKAVLDVELEAGRVSAPGATFEPGESVRDIRIVSPGALEISLLPVLAAILRSRAPHWSLTIEPFERRSYEIDLATGRVDFVLSVGGATPIGALVDAAIVWEDELVVLAGPRSALHAGSDRISTELYLRSNTSIRFLGRRHRTTSMWNWRELESTAKLPSPCRVMPPWGVCSRLRI